MRANGAGIGLIDVMLSGLGHAGGLGSFGCGVFASGDFAARLSCAALGVSEIAKVHQEGDRRRRDYGQATGRRND